RSPEFGHSYQKLHLGHFRFARHRAAPLYAHVAEFAARRKLSLQWRSLQLPDSRSRLLFRKIFSRGSGERHSRSTGDVGFGAGPGYGISFGPDRKLIHARNPATLSASDPTTRQALSDR